MSRMVDALMSRHGLTEHDAVEIVRFKAHIERVEGRPLAEWSNEDRAYAGLPPASKPEPSP